MTAAQIQEVMLPERVAQLITRGQRDPAGLLPGVSGGIPQGLQPLGPLFQGDSADVEIHIEPAADSPPQVTLEPNETLPGIGVVTKLIDQLLCVAGPPFVEQG